MLKKFLFRTRVVHVPITALFRDTVVHVPITALFRETVVHSPYVPITALFRHSGSHSVRADNGPFQGHHVCTTIKPVTNTLISPTGRANYIKLVHWNAQGAISKTSAIQTTIVQDDIDIVMIQDTRYKRRPDDLPNLRIQGYHTYYRTMDEGGHGLVTLVKHTIPSEAAGPSRLRRWHRDLIYPDLDQQQAATTTQPIQSGRGSGHHNSPY